MVKKEGMDSSSPSPSSKLLHIAMLPWLALGHMIPFMQLANEFAKRGHTVSFLLPETARLRLSNANLHPRLITFRTLSVPHVKGLPYGAETTSDTDNSLALSSAMDEMQEQVKAVLAEEKKPDIIFFDFANWIPNLASEIGCKAVFFSVVSPAIAAITLLISTSKEKLLTVSDVMEYLPNYPSSNRPVLRKNEAQALAGYANQPNNWMIEFLSKGVIGAKQSDALAVRACREMEGAHCDHLSMLYKKPVFCTGPLFPEPTDEPLDDKISNFLKKFGSASVVFCSFGSELFLDFSQFQELVLGLELTGLPFLLAGTKPPKGTTSIQDALPEGFQERVREKAVLYEGWVPQTQILRHTSIGCFVSHGGSASMWESLVSDCQIVFVPTRGDYCMNARLMAAELQLAVEVEMDENGRFSKESLSKGVKAAMDDDSEVGGQLKKNHTRWRDVFLRNGFADNYIGKFIRDLEKLL
ncbi:hypothetical protein DM860_003941 [Cuscuta australis]|uniref:Glycosyltransferase n=1 Tax=Cuscuta australis TaxID=267555 RepID=A0A328CYA8_9ASTE|nr:hypothetical protein DM860_003941 [Cuscuta australis]